MALQRLLLSLLVLQLLALSTLASSSAGQPAPPGRHRLLLGGNRPAHEYATSLASAASSQAIQQLLATTSDDGAGADPDAVRLATELSSRNAASSTKFLPNARVYDDGLSRSRVPNADDDEDGEGKD